MVDRDLEQLDGSAPSWQTASGFKNRSCEKCYFTSIAVTTDADPGQTVVYSEVTNVLTAQKVQVEWD